MSVAHFKHDKRLPLAAIDGDLAEEVAETMQALATPSRVRILARLRQSPCSVTDLADGVQLEPSAVSHQLRVLRHLGLVRSEEHTSELQSRVDLVCRLLLEKKKKIIITIFYITKKINKRINLVY